MPTTRLNFTNRALTALPTPTTGRADYKDDGARAARGLGLTVGSRSRTFWFVGKVDGRTVRYRIGDFPSVAVEAARRRARELAGEAAAGVDPNAARRARRAEAQTFADAYRRYIEDGLARSPNGKKKPLRTGTASAYAYAYRNHLQGFAERRLDEITPRMVAAWASSPSCRSRAPTRTAVKLASACWAHAERGGAAAGVVAAPNPFRAHAAELAEPEPRRGVIEPGELAAWLGALDTVASPVARDFIRTMLLSGLRRGEVCGLRWEDVDLERAAMTVRRTRIDVAPADGRTIAVADRFEAGTKNGLSPELPLAGALARLLARRRADAGDAPGTAWVFPSADIPGDAFCSPEHALKAVAEASGVKVTAHDLRRTFVTFGDRAGVTEHVLDRLTNHKPPQGVTRRHYVKHRTLGELRLDLERIVGAMLAAAGAPGNVVDLNARRAG